MKRLFLATAVALGMAATQASADIFTDPGSIGVGSTILRQHAQSQSPLYLAHPALTERHPPWPGHSRSRALKQFGVATENGVRGREVPG
jgi:hypothetical protein